MSDIVRQLFSFLSDDCITVSKAKRVTVRLDDELDAIINQACVDGNCDKTSVILSAIRRGLTSVDETDEPKPTPKGRLVDLDAEKPIVKGTLREMRPEEIGKIPKARAVHHLDTGGKPLWTDHYDENGKFQNRQEYRDL